MKMKQWCAPAPADEGQEAGIVRLFELVSGFEKCCKLPQWGLG